MNILWKICSIQSLSITCSNKKCIETKSIIFILKKKGFGVDSLSLKQSYTSCTIYNFSCYFVPVLLWTQTRIIKATNEKIQTVTLKLKNTNLNRCWSKGKELISCTFCVAIHIDKNMDAICMDAISGFAIARNLIIKLN